MIIPLNAPHFLYNDDLRLAPFHAFRVSFVTFVVSLVFYHIFFWLRRSVSSKHTARYIDYVYLIIAALGLIGAADIDRRVYSHDIENLVYLGQSHFSLASLIIEQSKVKCKSSPGPDCARLDDLARSAEEWRTKLEQKGTSVEEVRDALNKFDSELGADSKIKSYLDENWKMNGFNIKAEIAALQDPPFDIEDYYPFFGFETTMDTLRQVSYSLLASALALRVTRVSLEIFRWQRAS